MNNQATLYLFCGKMAAGKSTLAKQLANDHNAILLVEDDLLSQLYPEEIIDIPIWYSKFQVDEVKSLSKIPDFFKKLGIYLCTPLTWKAL